MKKNLREPLFQLFKTFLLRYQKFSFKTKIGSFKKRKISNDLILFRGEKRVINSTFFFLLSNIQNYFKGKNDNLDLELLEDFWIRLLPNRFLLSLTTFFLSKERHNYQKRSVLFDPFHKVLYGIFLLVRKKKPPRNLRLELKQTLRFFSTILFQKAEQEKQKIDFFFKVQKFDLSFRNQKMNTTFFFFLDKFKCSVPVSSGRFLYFSLFLKKDIPIAPINPRIFILFCSSFFKQFLPFNFFSSCQNSKNFLSRKSQKKKLIRERELGNFRLNFPMTSRKSIINKKKLKGLTSNFFDLENFRFFTLFNFLWMKKKSNTWLINVHKTLKKTFRITGPGIFDPFLNDSKIFITSKSFLVRRKSFLLIKKPISLKKREFFSAEKIFSENSNFSLSVEKKKKKKQNKKKSEKTRKFFKILPGILDFKKKVLKSFS